MTRALSEGGDQTGKDRILAQPWGPIFEGPEDGTQTLPLGVPG